MSIHVYPQRSKAAIALLAGATGRPAVPPRSPATRSLSTCKAWATASCASLASAMVKEFFSVSWQDGRCFDLRPFGQAFVGGSSSSSPPPLLKTFRSEVRSPSAVLFSCSELVGSCCSEFGADFMRKKWTSSEHPGIQRCLVARVSTEQPFKRRPDSPLRSSGSKPHLVNGQVKGLTSLPNRFYSDGRSVVNDEVFAEQLQPTRPSNLLRVQVSPRTGSSRTFVSKVGLAWV